MAVKVIKHISSGIYRTPGGALKELVSNAFDAQATEVRIESGYPDFTKIRIEDNGFGMSRDVVDVSFEHVGASVKIVQPELFEGKIKRPIIGQFGIGMLASAHLSKEIRIVTYPRNQDYGLEIFLDLSPYFKYETQIKTLEEFTFGSVSYRRIEKKENEHGTTVELTKIEPGSNFHRTISSRASFSLIHWPSKGKDESRLGQTMMEFVKRMDNIGIRTIEELSGREQILWELGIICPVEYLDGGPIHDKYLDRETRGIVNRLRGDLRNLRFKLYFDGVEVRKPILLPTKKRRRTFNDMNEENFPSDIHVYPIEIKKKVSDKPAVEAEGYLLFQPHRIFPQELRGLYPRLRHVGVGHYDNNMFKAIRGEQPLLRIMLSGEIQIETGLDDALNLDRSGFIELDEGYQVLRDALKEIIGFGKDAIATKAHKASSDRTKRIREIKAQRRKAEIAEKVAKYVRGIAPSYSVSAKGAEEIEGSPRVTSYGIVAINHSAQRIYFDPDIEDPRLVAIIVAVDIILGQMANAQDMRNDVARKLREIMSS